MTGAACPEHPAACEGLLLSLCCHLSFEVQPFGESPHRWDQGADSRQKEPFGLSLPVGESGEEPGRRETS